MEFADSPRQRPLAFDKMESLIKEMQDPETGVPVRSQKLFLTSIPSAFMGYDLIEWLMERLTIEESVEAINIANQLCQYGYFFPVSDSKNLGIKDDSSLYRFQTPYYWPWQQRGSPAAGVGSVGGSSAAPSPVLGNPDNMEYAIYLCKRTLRNKQRHGLEEHEAEALAGLKKNLQGKWEFVAMQADEQVRLAKERKKGDKIVSDSQERAYWRVYRPPPGIPSPLEPCPIPNRCRNGLKTKRRSVEQVQKEMELLKLGLNRTRIKVSTALEALLQYAETYSEYDPYIIQIQPSNPWVNDDITFWQINGPLVEIPIEKRVKKWGLSMEELVIDPTGIQEFTAYLRKEYSHENIRFWMAAIDLRRSAHSQIQRKLNKIYEEFLSPGAPCEINIDGATMEKVQQGLKSPNRFALDAAAEHVYALLLKKDCYPRFIRSDFYRSLLAAGRQPQQKKRFFGFGGPVKKKSSTTTPPTISQLSQQTSSGSGGVLAQAGTSSGTLTRRRGSDRSLSGSAHELAISGVNQPSQRVSHSHSQSNLSDLPYRETIDDDTVDPTACSWENSSTHYRKRKDSIPDSGSSSSDLSAVTVPERSRRILPQQNTLDGGLRGAPPPLRRLSAIEPRHLPPLASPPNTPHYETKSDNSAKILNVLTKSLSINVTSAPLISVSSAEEDEIIGPETIRLRADTLDEEMESSDRSNSSNLSISSSLPKLAVEVSSPKPDVAESSSTLLREGSQDTNEGVKAISCDEEPRTEGGSAERRDCLVSDMPRRVSVAPLAESEDAGVDDDDEKVPLVQIFKPDPDIEETSNITEKPSIETAAADDATKEEVKVESKDEVEQGGATKTQVQQNDVCPWEDEDTCKVEGPFVKTYATLGYL